MILSTSPPRLLSCFWEITRDCPSQCVFCRVRPGSPPGTTLDTIEALELCDALAAVQTKQVILTGGEPLLRDDLEEIVERLSAGGIRVRLATSGALLSSRRLEKLCRAGVGEYALPLDGPEEVHDALRPSSATAYRDVVDALENLAALGQRTRVVTQVNRRNLATLGEILSLVLELGVSRWQVQLFQPTGAGAQCPDLVLHPADLEAVFAVLSRAATHRELAVPLHCTLGYLTPEEFGLRRRPGPWRGCRAGIRTLGILPDGRVKGCITLPDEFVTASLRERALRAVWQDDSIFPYTRGWQPEVLDGVCADCRVAVRCRAGCPSVAYAITGTIGNNPLCLRNARRRTL